MKHRALLLVAICAAVPALSAQQPLTLRQVIDLAEQKGLQARQAMDARDGTRWRDRAFGSSFLPQLSLNGSLPSYSKSIVPITQPDGSTLYTPLTTTDTKVGLGIFQQIPWTGGQLQLNSSLDNLQLSGAPGRWSSVPMSISLSQPFLRENSARWNIRDNALTTEVSERVYLESREGVAINASFAFFNLYSARMQLKNSEANAAINDTLYRLNKGRYEVGKIGENDLLQSELQLLNARGSRDAAQVTLENALAQLRLTVNYPPDAPIDVVVTNDVPIFDADPAMAIAQALKNPSLNANLELARLRADRSVNSAKLSAGPNGTVNLSYGYNAAASSYDGVYQNLLPSQGFGLSVSMPIVQWGQGRELVHAAESDRDRTIASNQMQRDQAAVQARFAALRLSLARTQLTIAAKADTVGQKRFDVAYNRYTVSKITITDLFQAQADKDLALLGYVQALGNYWSAYYLLRQLTLYDFERREPLR